MSADRERVRAAAVSLRCGATRGSRRGQAIIELAIILPLFLILIGGVVDFGVFMFQREQAASCVRTVARMASVRNPTADDFTELQCQKASSESALDLTPGYMTLDAGLPVTAEIDYQYTPVFLSLAIPMDGWSPIPTMQVTAIVTMSMEAQAST